ncbi:6721_t:CDS:2, partial [Racocetra fulgida]
MERREAEERARTEELDSHVKKEKEILDDPRDNVLGKQKQVITLDNIDRYT